MKKIFLSIILLLSINLYAQEIKAVIIPNGEEGKFRKILITPFDGVGAVQLKSGDWFIRESNYKRLPVTLTVTVKEIQPVTLKEIEVVYNVKTELSKLPIKTLIPTDYKIAEAIEPIPVIIKK